MKIDLYAKETSESVRVAAFGEGYDITDKSEERGFGREEVWDDVDGGRLWYSQEKSSGSDGGVCEGRRVQSDDV